MSHLIGTTGLKIFGLFGLSCYSGSFNHHLSVNRIHLSCSDVLCSKKASKGDDELWLAQFEKENELIFGPTRDTTSSSRRQSNNQYSSESRHLSSLEIVENYTEVLPVSWNPDKLIKFPIINPLRIPKRSSKAVTITKDDQVDTIGLINEEEELNVKRNLILDNANLKVKQFPSVTKVIGETMPASSRQALESWKGRMIEKLGEEGFKEYQQKVFRRGYCLHQNIALRLEEKLGQVEITDEISGYWKSLENVFSHISSVKLLEKPVVHPFLCYRGIIDCVANYQSSCYLIDWKTSSRPKPTIYNLYDEPLQVVSYLGALNFDLKYDYQVMKAAIVIAYEDGSPAHVHRLSESLCKNYWIKWIRRLDQYWSSSLKK